MKKSYIFLIGLLLLTTQTQANTNTPTLEINISPGSKSTQHILPSTKNIEILRFRLLSSNHKNLNTQINKIKFQHIHNTEQDQIHQILRYKLQQENKTLSTISLPDSNSPEFTNLEILIKDNKTTELKILADISIGEFSGTHQFEITTPDFITTQNQETQISGNFPIKANKIIIGQKSQSPPNECNFREEPICGKDNKTYFNRCIAYKKNIKIAHQGPCEIITKKPKTPCPEEIDTICGKDNRTYQNTCFLNQTSTTQKHTGECFPNTFTQPKTLTKATKLFSLKKNELIQIRPRIKQEAENKLTSIEQTLKNYKFTQTPKRNIIPKITNFLNFTKNPSDREILNQEIDKLLLTIKLNKSQSAREKYETKEIPFLDVETQEWFFEPVKFLKEKQWIQGFINEKGEQTGLFHPARPVTKAEVTKLAFAAANIDWKNKIKKPTNPFAKKHWAANLIARGEEKQLNMWKWWPNPDKKATRTEVIRLILEIFKITPPNTLAKKSFKDVTPYDKDYRYIEHAKALNLISGYPDGTFQGEEPISRAEVAKIIKNASEFFKTQ